MNRQFPILGAFLLFVLGTAGCDCCPEQTEIRAKRLHSNVYLVTSVPDTGRVATSVPDTMYMTSVPDTGMYVLPEEFVLKRNL